MRFPTPPPLKPKRRIPVVTMHRAPRRTVWFILGVSIGFWVLVVVGLAALALALTPNLWSGRPWSGFVVPVVIFVAVWSGLGLGWRFGRAAVLHRLPQYVDITPPV